MNSHPPLSWFDVSYATAGALLLVIGMWPDWLGASWIWFLCLLAYCAGRAVGAGGVYARIEKANTTAPKGRRADDTGPRPDAP